MVANTFSNTTEISLCSFIEFLWYLNNPDYFNENKISTITNKNPFSIVLSYVVCGSNVILEKCILYFIFSQEGLKDFDKKN